MKKHELRKKLDEKWECLKRENRLHDFYKAREIQWYQGFGRKKDFKLHEKDIIERGESLASSVLSRFPDFTDGIAAFLDNNKKNLYKNAYNKVLWGDHKGLYSTNEKGGESNEQREKNIAKGLFNRKNRMRNILFGGRKLTRDIGEIMDYEVPLFNSGNRNIDLISKRGEKLYLLELKKNRSMETLLRCLLEVYTYSCFVDRKRIRESYGIGVNGRIVVCPLIFKDSPAYIELSSCYTPEREKTSQFVKIVETIKKGGIDVAFAVIDSDKTADAFPADSNGREFDGTWLK